MGSAEDRVVPLDQLDDYRVAEGDPDVRGWDVHTSDGRRVGQVDNLLVDMDALKVRYLDVDLDDELIGDEIDRHVLLPVGYAHLDENDDRIFVEGVSPDELMGIPAYRREPVTEEYEARVQSHFDRETDPARSGAPSAAEREPAAGDRVGGDEELGNTAG